MLYDPESLTVREVRAYMAKAIEKGERCPCCDQYAKIYRRKLGASMARAIIDMYIAGRTSWVHAPTVCKNGNHDEAKLRYWGLTEEDDNAGGERGGRSGYWRVTARGEQFVLGRTTVPRYARIYLGRLMSLEGAEIPIAVALGDASAYTRLMSVVPSLGEDEEEKETHDE